MLASLAITCIALVGCASTQVYPICLIETGGFSSKAMWERSKPDLIRIINSVGVNKKARVVMTPQVALFRGLEFEHRNLRRIWPTVACIVSPDSGLAGDIIRRECQKEVATYFVEMPPSWPGDLAKTTTVCSATE